MSAAIATEADRLDVSARELDRPGRSLEDAMRAEEMQEEARLIRQRIKSSREHLENYYGLRLDVGTRVTADGRPGRVVGFSGQYVAVLIDGETEPTTRHPTSGMEYPEGVQVGPGPDERFAHLVQVTAASD